MNPVQDDKTQANQATQAIADDLDQLTHDPVPTLSEEITAEFGGKEKEPHKIVEIPTHPEIEKHPELEGYIEKVEKEAELKNPVMDDKTGQILVQSSTPQKPKIKLPLSDGQIEEGLHHKIWESIRWLAVWCQRQLELIHGHLSS